MPPSPQKLPKDPTNFNGSVAQTGRASPSHQPNLTDGETDREREIPCFSKTKRLSWSWNRGSWSPSESRAPILTPWRCLRVSGCFVLLFHRCRHSCNKCKINFRPCPTRSLEEISFEFVVSLQWVCAPYFRGSGVNEWVVFGPTSARHLPNFLLRVEVPYFCLV